MEISEKELKENYKKRDNEDLISIFFEGGLTNKAKKILEEELSNRKIDLDDYKIKYIKKEQIIENLCIKKIEKKQTPKLNINLLQIKYIILAYYIIFVLYAWYTPSNANDRIPLNIFFIRITIELCWLLFILLIIFRKRQLIISSFISGFFCTFSILIFLYVFFHANSIVFPVIVNYAIISGLLCITDNYKNGNILFESFLFTIVQIALDFFLFMLIVKPSFRT